MSADYDPLKLQTEVNRLISINRGSPQAIAEVAIKARWMLEQNHTDNKMVQRELLARAEKASAFLRKIMLLGLLRGSPRLRDEALQILDSNEHAGGDICPDCGGSGEVAGDYFADDGMMICPHCGGKGGKE